MSAATEPITDPTAVSDDLARAISAEAESVEELARDIADAVRRGAATARQQARALILLGKVRRKLEALDDGIQMGSDEAEAFGKFLTAEMSA